MNHDDTSNPPIEGGDAHQSARGLDAFSVQQGPAMQGEGGALGAPVDEPAAPEPSAEELRAAARREQLARNTWANRGAELAARVLARVDGTEAPVLTPWASVNTRMGGGLWPGMHVVVGGTGTGKSQWALQVCIGAARAGVPVLVLSLELDALGVFARGASFFTQDAARADGSALPAVKWSAFYNGGRAATEAKTERDRARVREALPHVLPAMQVLPLHWFEAPPHGLPHTEIAALVHDLRALHPEHVGPVVVVIDFLQLVAGADPREDTITRVSRASYACRAAARELGAVVLVLSSTSRVSADATRIDAREDPTTPPELPFASDLVGLGKESGDVEFSADSVLVLCPESLPKDGPNGQKPATLKGGRAVHLAVAKLRAGVPGWCEFRFNGSRFLEAPRPAGEGETWCEGCDANVRARPHPSREGMLMCPNGGHVIEAHDDAPRAMTLPPTQPKGGKRGGRKSSSAPTAPADTAPDHPVESDR